jgi:predicted O-linked N-acetylglucosamine transferase (SPINDLY family)
MVAHTKVDPRFDRLTPFVQGYDDTINELNRQFASTVDQMDGLTATQKAANLADINASLNTSINRAVGEVNTANAKNAYDTYVANKTIQQQEETGRMNSALDYEQRQLKALAATEQDYNDYLYKSRQIRINRFKYLQKYKQIHDLIDTFKIAPDGSKVLDTNAQLVGGNVRTTPEYLQQKRGAKTTTTETKKSSNGSTTTKKTYKE